MEPLEVCSLHNVTKTYRDRAGSEIVVFQDFSLRLIAADPSRGNVFVVLGRSGCGKTTLLDMLAGIQVPTRGTISVLGEKTASGKTALMPQEPSCFPWLSAQENIEFGLSLRKQHSSNHYKAISARLLQRVGLEGRGSSYSRHLSGGMQQRVALARTLAVTPSLLLLDEPFGSLDSETRTEMHSLLQSTLTVERNHVVFVTHDVEEAVALGDTVVILPSSHEGRAVLQPVPFEFPRDRKLRSTDAYLQFVDSLKLALAHC